MCWAASATYYDPDQRVAWTAEHLTPLTFDSRGQPTFQLRPGSTGASPDQLRVLDGSLVFTAWGEVQRGTVSTFGFTSELQTDGLVHLRARWYSAPKNLHRRHTWIMWG